MAICTTGAEWGSESTYFSGPLVQILQAIFRRTVRRGSLASCRSTIELHPHGGFAILDFQLLIVTETALRLVYVKALAHALSSTNQLLLGSRRAGAIESEVQMPVDKIPTVACQVNGGAQWQFAQQSKKRQQRAKRYLTPCFKRRLPDSAEDYDWLSSQQAPAEEAQAAVVSGFLSFVPFQILKWTRRDVET